MLILRLYIVLLVALCELYKIYHSNPSLLISSWCLQNPSFKVLSL